MSSNNPHQNGAVPPIQEPVTYCAKCGRSVQPGEACGYCRTENWFLRILLISTITTFGGCGACFVGITSGQVDHQSTLPYFGQVLMISSYPIAILASIIILIWRSLRYRRKRK